MSLKFSFSWIGLAVFVLPMLINIIYVVFPPVGEKMQSVAMPRLLEVIEQVSRIAYLLALVLFVSEKPLVWRSTWLYLAIVFLLLYYAVWIRYFAHGREVSLLERSFFFVPIPLAVFPALYFLCAAIWMHNIPAAIAMLIFGAAHITVSVRSFQ